MRLLLWVRRALLSITFVAVVVMSTYVGIFPFHASMPLYLVLIISNLNHSLCADAGFVGTVEKSSEVLAAEQKEVFETANAKEISKKEKNKKRGKNKISAKIRRKQKNVVDAQMLKLKSKQAAERLERALAGNSNSTETAMQLSILNNSSNNASAAAASTFQGALNRFYKK
jgi:hypothetical protein